MSNAPDPQSRSLQAIASALESVLGHDRTYAVFSAAFNASGGDGTMQECLLRGAMPFFDQAGSAAWAREFLVFLGTPACAALVSFGARKAAAATTSPLDLTGGGDAFERRARLVGRAYSLVADGTQTRFHVARIVSVSGTGIQNSPLGGTMVAPYDGEKIDWNSLRISINTIIGKSGGAGELFDRCLISFCADRPVSMAIEVFAKTMEAFRSALVPGSGEDLALFFGIVLSLEASRGLEAWDAFSMLARAWSKNGFGPREASLALADFHVDERYTSDMLKTLFPLIETCAAMFHPLKTAIFARVFKLVKNFVRYARSTDKYAVSRIFDAVVRHPTLDLGAWVDEGARVVRTEGARSQEVRQYFDRKSDHSQKIWATLDSGIEFETVRERFTWLVQALSGQPVALRAYRDDTLHIVDPVAATGPESSKAEPVREHRFFTDGKTIWVPPRVNYVDDARLNLLMLRHGAAHESAHIEYGSFRQDPVRFSLAAGKFDPLFPHALDRNRRLFSNYAKQVEAALTALGFIVKKAKVRNFSDFPDQVRLGFMTPFPTLFRDVLNIVEDYRVNALLYSRYPGYAKEKAEVDRIDLGAIKDLAGFNAETRPLQALIERLWFGRVKGELDAGDVVALDGMASRLNGFDPFTADAYDAAVVAARILKAWLGDIAQRFPLVMARLQAETDTLKISFASLEAAGQNRNCPLQFEIEGALSGGPFAESGGTDGVDRNGDKEAFRRTYADHGGAETAKMEALVSDRKFWRYDEWDNGELAYIRDKCLLVEMDAKSVADGNPELSSLVSLEAGRAAGVRKAFLALKESLNTIRTGLDDGDEIDFDRCFDALLEFKAGGSMEDDFYMQRSRKTRDVACALALDFSPSTHRIIGDRSVFAHEASAAYLLSEAMRSLEDRYGVYAIYDLGANANILHVIKDMDEDPAGTLVAAKLSSLTPPWQGFSRMSPCLRHIIAEKLGPVQAKVKLLFFITDGKPFYVDRIVDGKGAKSKTYVEDGVQMVSEKAIPVSWIHGPSENYAWMDLARVFEESLDAGIRMICITLDAGTINRLTMIFGNSLIYLSDVSALPARLVEWFRKITR